MAMPQNKARRLNVPKDTTLDAMSKSQIAAAILKLAAMNQKDPRVKIGMHNLMASLAKRFDLMVVNPGKTDFGSREILPPEHSC